MKPNCPPDYVWAELLVEACRPEDAQVLYGHARCCERCGDALLRAQLADLEDPPDFEEALNDVRNRVLEQVKSHQGFKSRSPRAWLWIPGAVLAAAVVLLMLRSEPGPKDPKSLAHRIDVSVPQIPKRESRAIEQPRSLSVKSDPASSLPVSSIPTIRHHPHRIHRATPNPKPEPNPEPGPGLHVPDPVLIQQSPTLVIYWVQPITGGVS